MATKKNTTPHPGATHAAPTAPHHPLPEPDLKIAISRAHAAWWLLDSMMMGLVRPESSFKGAYPRTIKESDDLTGWLRGWALQALRDSLAEIETEVKRKNAHGGPAMAGGGAV